MAAQRTQCEYELNVPMLCNQHRHIHYSKHIFYARKCTAISKVPFHRCSSRIVSIAELSNIHCVALQNITPCAVKITIQFDANSVFAVLYLHRILTQAPGTVNCYALINYPRLKFKNIRIIAHAAIIRLSHFVNWWIAAQRVFALLNR